MKKQFVFEAIISEKGEVECDNHEKYGRQTLMMKLLSYLTNATLNTRISFVRVEDEQHPNQEELDGL